MTVAAPPLAGSFDDVMSRELRIGMAKKSLPFFAATYFRDEHDEQFIFMPFHIELMEACVSEDPEVVVLEPAGTGKTTILAMLYPTWLVCCDPNVRIGMVTKTYDDGKARLQSIKQSFEQNEKLIADFGPFVSDRWTADSIFVKRRTLPSSVKDPTIMVFGAGMNVYGWRFNYMLIDDMVTPQNSGAQVRDETRKALHTNYFMGIKRVGTGRNPVKIRWAQTVVDLRDLVHQVADLKRHPDPSDTNWKTPRGVRVIRRQARNDATGELLWPDWYTDEALDAMRAEDEVGYLRRMQNICIEPEMMSFQAAWFEGDPAQGLPGCLDIARSYGDNVGGPRGAGYDPNFGLSDSAKYCGYVEGVYGGSPENESYIITDIRKFRTGVEEQGEFLSEKMDRAGVRWIVVERNAQNQMVINLRKIRGDRRIKPHWTDDQNKPDPAVGLPSLANIVKAGRVRFAYGDSKSRAATDAIISEFVTHPMSITTDLLMAFWFFVIGARDARKRSSIGVISQTIPGWAQRRGLSYELAKRLFPTKVN